MVDGRALPVTANVIQEEVMYGKVSKTLPNTAITQQHTGGIACKLFSGTHNMPTPAPNPFLPLPYFSSS